MSGQVNISKKSSLLTTARVPFEDRVLAAVGPVIAQAVEDYLIANPPTGVNADWNAVSGPAQILNKPAILAFTGLEKITVGTSAPVAPSVGDIWIDTNN